MRKVNLLSYAVILLIVVFSTNLFAAERVALKKAVKLPAVIKINPAVVDINTALLDANIEKNKKSVEHIKSLASLSLTDNINKIESGTAKLKNKITECKNKAYTAQDQKAANCTDDMTVEACGKMLFSACIKEEKKWVQTQVSALNYNTKIIKDETDSIAKTNHDINTSINNMSK